MPPPDEKPILLSEAACLQAEQVLVVRAYSATPDGDAEVLLGVGPGVPREICVISPEAARDLGTALLAAARNARRVISPRPTPSYGKRDRVCAERHAADRHDRL